MIKPPGGLIYFKPIWGGRGGRGLIETGGLFNLEKTMVSVLHIELNKKGWRSYAAQDQNEIRTSSW